MKRRTKSETQSQPQGAQELLTVDEAAAFLRLTRATIYKLVKQGELPSHRFGASIRLSKHKLLELAEVRE